MGTKLTQFFATRKDVLAVLERLEALGSYQYVLSELQDQPSVVSYSSAIHIPDLGKSTIGSYHTENTYIIIDSRTVIYPRIITRGRNQSPLYTVDVDIYPEGIIISPGGIFQDQYLILGSFGVGNDNAVAIALYRQLARLTRKDFTRIRSYWLGPEALELFDSGFCLTSNIRSPVSCLERTEDNSYW